MTVQWKNACVGLAAGLLLGGAVGLGLGWQRRPHWNSAEHYQRVLARFNSRLKLTPGQKDEVAKLLEAKRVRVEELRAQSRPKFEALRATTRAEIRKLLTPDQQAHFDAMEAEWEARRRERGHP